MFTPQENKTINQIITNITNLLTEGIKTYDPNLKIQHTIKVYTNGKMEITIKNTSNNIAYSLKEFSTYTYSFHYKQFKQYVYKIEKHFKEHKKAIELKAELNNNKYNAVINCLNQNIPIAYIYDLCSVLSFEKVNKKSITCIDSTGKKHYLTKQHINNLIIEGFCI